MKIVFYTFVLNFIFLNLIFLSNIAFAQSKIPTEKEISDGRFSLGDGRNSFLFGYPFNYSTSHFIVNASGRIASNSPNLHKVKYLTGNVAENKGRGSSSSEAVFEFAGFRIHQIIEPVDKDFKVISNDVYGKFYKLTYKLVNENELPQEAGLVLLLDINAYSNDRANTFLTTGKAIKLNEQFVAAAVPEELIFGKTGSVSSSEQFSVVVSGKEATTPNSLCVGHWPYLVNIFDFLSVENNNNSYDTSLMMQWKSPAINPKDSVIFSTYIGNKNAKELNMQLFKTEKVEQVTVYFEKGKSEISENAAFILEGFIIGKRVKAVLVEGFADATGDETKNLVLSEGRIDNVAVKLQMHGVPFEKILKKSYGEFFAHQYTSESDKDERKVIVTIWR